MSDAQNITKKERRMRCARRRNVTKACVYAYNTKFSIQKMTKYTFLKVDDSFITSATILE